MLSLGKARGWKEEISSFLATFFFFAVPKVFVVSMTFSKINHVCLYIQNKSSAEEVLAKEEGRNLACAIHLASSFLCYNPASHGFL